MPKPLERLLTQRIDLLIQAVQQVMDERHTFYLRLFEESDKHVARALAALHSNKEESGANLSNWIALGALAVAVIALVAVFLKR